MNKIQLIPNLKRKKKTYHDRKYKILTNIDYLFKIYKFTVILRIVWGNIFKTIENIVNDLKLFVPCANVSKKN